MNTPIFMRHGFGGLAGGAVVLSTVGLERLRKTVE